MNVFTETPLFKMVISSTTPNTAKTIATLAHKLHLNRYKDIIIVDDDGRASWCKHEMIRWRLHHKVNFILLQVPVFSIWDRVYRDLRKLPKSQRKHRFYPFIKAKQNEDSVFSSLSAFLTLLHQNVNNLLTQFAMPIRDRNCSSQMTPAWWPDWYQFASDIKIFNGRIKLYLPDFDKICASR